MTSNSGDKIIKKQVDTMQVSYDKEAAWMRLQDRMESKDERRRPVWVGWAAAAMLVLGTVLWYGLSERGEKAVVKKAIPKQAPAVTPIAEKQLATIPVVTEKEEMPVQVKKTTVNNKIKAPMPAPAPINAPEEPEVKELIAVSPVVTPDLVPEPAPIVAAPKKKMKRVHINDMVEDERARQRDQRQEMYDRYAAGRKNSFVKPATDREEAEENAYSLLGRIKTEIN